MILFQRDIVLPQILPFNFGDDQINLHDAVSATCTVTKGDLPLDIWWMLSEIDSPSEQKLSTNDGLGITRAGNKLSVLNIESVKGRHRGNYTCYARNKAGTVQFSTQLAINGDSISKYLSNDP